MADTKRRRGEHTATYRARKKEVSRAEGATAAQRREGQMEHWRKRYTEETGRDPSGIANAAKFNSWLEKKRRDALAKRKIAKPTMKEAGDALAEASPD